MTPSYSARGHWAKAGLPACACCRDPFRSGFRSGGARYTLHWTVEGIITKWVRAELVSVFILWLTSSYRCFAHVRDHPWRHSWRSFQTPQGLLWHCSPWFLNILHIVSFEALSNQFSAVEFVNIHKKARTKTSWTVGTGTVSIVLLALELVTQLIPSQCRASGLLSLPCRITPT